MVIVFTNEKLNGHQDFESLGLLGALTFLKVGAWIESTDIFFDVFIQNCTVHLAL